MKNVGVGYCVRFAMCMLFSVLAAVLLPYRAKAAAEIGENYVMYDFCEYDGDSSLPFGKGSNGNCYYPRGNDAEYVFPEVYTWEKATLSETDDGVRLCANRTGTDISTTVDKVPAIYGQSVQDHFGYLILHIKANTKGENTVTFRSPGNNYIREYDVTYTGEWQSIVLDLSKADGWQKKNSDGSYSYITVSPWEKGYFGTDGFGIGYTSFGKDIKSEVLIRYYAFTDDASLVLRNGKTYSQKAYLKGGTDGLIRPNDPLTRLQASVMVTRILGYDDDVCAPQDHTCRFVDISGEDFGYNYIVLLDSLGILSMFGDEFCPDAPLKVSELCAMLVNANVCRDGMMQGYVAPIYDNSDIITRAQGCAVINLLTGRSTAPFSDGLSFADVTASFPMYKDIVSAYLSADIKELADGSTEVLSVYKEPDYVLSEKMKADIDERANELYLSIHNSKSEFEASEKCYYVSPNGNDSFDGTTPSTAWRTLNKVNKVGFSAGSTVFFERGGLWRGTLRILPNVTYTAYGEGDKPTIYGSLYDGADVSLWTLVDGTDNVWRFRYDMPDCGSVVFDHGKYHSFKETPSYNGLIYLHRNTNREFDYRSDISCDLGIFCDNKREPDKECPLYLRCDDGNPGELFESIEFLPRGDIMDVVANRNVVIDNFCLKYGGSHGIGAGTVENFTVRNCEFSWIGGSIQHYNPGSGTMPVRYGNAIESYGAPNGFYVHNNYIHQIYDAGITHQLSGGTQASAVQKNIRYANNLIEYCSYSVEYFLGDASDGASDRYMENVVIEDNIMRYAGFGFGNQRTDRLCMSHIKSGDGRNAVSENFVIRNNIFDRSREMLINISAYQSDDLPILSGNTYIQYETAPETPHSTFGKYGKSPARLRFFTKDIKNIMTGLSVDTAATVYHTKKDRLYELADY